MECEQTMTDYEAFFREILSTEEDLAALDSLVAERDETRQANAEKRELLTKAALRISQLEVERDEARRERDAARIANESLLANYYDERNRAETAEAERDKANADWHRMRDLHDAAITDLRAAEAERGEARGQASTKQAKEE